MYALSKNRKAGKNASERRSDRLRQLVVILACGLVVGAAFNAGFHAAIYEIEGLFGGALSAFLIYLMS
jgi:hypothetical protein